MRRGPRPKKPPDPFPVSSLVLPICSSMRTIQKLERLKALTDVLVSWLREHGYRELSVEIFGATIGPPGEYRVSLKEDGD